MNQLKDTFLQIRLTSEQKESIRDAAANANTDMSSWILSKVVNSQSKKFLMIVEKLASDKKLSYVYAELHDFLINCNSTSFSLAVQAFPNLNLSSFQSNYIAAMVEQRAQQLGEKIPNWCTEITRLDAPYFGTSLKSLNFYLLLNSPIAFRRRNIFIDSSIGDRI